MRRARMTPLDATFLQAEDAEPNSSLAIASVAIFAGPAPTLKEFRGHLVARVPLIPRNRQKVRQIPFDLATPEWVDDNVPGPHKPLYALGRELLELVPYAPIASTIRIGVSIFSYRDRVTFGLTGDESAEDLNVLGTGIEDDLRALGQRAGAGPAAVVTVVPASAPQ